MPTWFDTNFDTSAILWRFSAIIRHSFDSKPGCTFTMGTPPEKAFSSYVSSIWKCKSHQYQIRTQLYDQYWIEPNVPALIHIHYCKLSISAFHIRREQVYCYVLRVRSAHGMWYDNELNNHIASKVYPCGYDDSDAFEGLNEDVNLYKRHIHIRVQ